MDEHLHIHWKYDKIYAQYLKGTIHYDMTYMRDGNMILYRFVNSYWEMDAKKKKKYFRVLLQVWIRYDFVVQQEAIAS